ncbi:MAG: family 3 glycosyl hydrolase, partial [Acidobacteriaceae bacterium]
MMRTTLLAALLALSSVALGAQNAAPPPYKNPSLPIEQRITDLIHRMTLDEKAELLNHMNDGIPRLDVPRWGGWNQTLHGVWSKQPTTLFP